MEIFARLAMSSSHPNASVNARTAHHSHLEETIHNPGAVKFDVRGAYIVDDDDDDAAQLGGRHGNRDIRLPNHSGVVSHVAVDVSVASPSPLRRPLQRVSLHTIKEEWSLTCDHV